MTEFLRSVFKFQLPKFNKTGAKDQNKNVPPPSPPVYKSQKRMPLFLPCFGYGLNEPSDVSDHSHKKTVDSRGPSLQGAVKMIAVINTILALMMVFDWALSTTFVIVNNGSLKDHYQEFVCTESGKPQPHIFGVYSSNIRYHMGRVVDGGCKSVLIENYDLTMYYRIFDILYWISTGVLAKVLFRAAVQRTRPSLMVWATAEVILLAFWAILRIVKEVIVFQKVGIGNIELVLVAFGIPIFYKCYTFWVIHCFVKELRDSDQDSPWTDTAKLKPDEVNEAQSVDVDGHFVEYISKPWPENKEIDPRNLKIDHLIGRGIHGSVFRAVLDLTDGQTGEAMPSAYVAVKKIRIDMDDKNYGAILNELKIMNYIGTHPNIVNLIGACTTKISERKLDIVLEYCPYPNLEDYLKANRGFFKNQLLRGGLYGTIDMGSEQVSAVYSTLAEIANSKGLHLELVTTSDLVQWAIDIATGMQFLHSKKILHADLALRNVLLSTEKVAKITDFGFSQSLYSVAKPYIPQKLSDLPWRWMAPEAIAFDTKRVLQLESDNWSYGVTLYELFSLSEPPYPRHRFNKAFVEIIKVKPLEMPPFVPREIYDNVMRRCWALHPVERISWPEIIEELAIAMRNLNRPPLPSPPPQQSQTKPIVYVSPSEKIYYSSIEEEQVQEKSYVAVPMKKWRPDGSFIMVEELRPLSSNRHNSSSSTRKPPVGSSFTSKPSRASGSFSHHPARTFQASSGGSGSFSHRPGRSAQAPPSASSDFSHQSRRHDQEEAEEAGFSASFSNQSARDSYNVFRTPTTLPMPSPTSPVASPRPYMHLQAHINDNRLSNA